AEGVPVGCRAPAATTRSAGGERPDQGKIAEQGSSAGFSVKEGWVERSGRGEPIPKRHAPHCAFRPVGLSKSAGKSASPRASFTGTGPGHRILDTTQSDLASPPRSQDGPLTAGSPRPPCRPGPGGVQV